MITQSKTDLTNMKDFRNSHKCDGCKWFNYIRPVDCGHAKLHEDCFEADDTVCKSDNAIDNLYMEGKPDYDLTVPKEDVPEIQVEPPDGESCLKFWFVPDVCQQAEKCTCKECRYFKYDEIMFCEKHKCMISDEYEAGCEEGEFVYEGQEETEMLMAFFNWAKEEGLFRDDCCFDLQHQCHTFVTQLYPKIKDKK